MPMNISHGCSLFVDAGWGETGCVKPLCEELPLVGSCLKYVGAEEPVVAVTG